MLATGWRVTLVLGGLGSGHSAFARSLLTGASRRVTADSVAGPAGLARLLAEAKPDETLLIDPVDAWLPGSWPSHGFDCWEPALRPKPGLLLPSSRSPTSSF